MASNRSFRKDAHSEIEIQCGINAFKLWQLAEAAYRQTGKKNFLISFQDYGELLRIKRSIVENIRNSLCEILCSVIVIPIMKDESKEINLAPFTRFAINEQAEIINAGVNPLLFGIDRKRISMGIQNSCWLRALIGLGNVQAIRNCQPFPAEHVSNMEQVAFQPC